MVNITEVISNIQLPISDFLIDPNLPYGDTTINAKTEIKGDLEAPKAVIDNVEAKTSFKSKNISDGVAVPGAGGGGSLSAKLKSEDAPAA